MRDKRFSSTISPTRLELDATIYLRRENEGKREGGGGGERFRGKTKVPLTRLTHFTTRSTSARCRRGIKGEGLVRGRLVFHGERATEAFAKTFAASLFVYERCVTFFSLRAVLQTSYIFNNG